MKKPPKVPKMNKKKIQNMLTGKTRISPMNVEARDKQLSDFEKAQLLNAAIAKKTGTYPNTTR